MKNIHVLPTDKPSRLVKNNLGIAINEDFTQSDLDLIQAIYITNDESIKERDWCYDVALKVFQASHNFNGYNTNLCKKIILTTDPQLITDGVQAIDDEFLEWFCSKNSSCEFVKVIHKFDEGWSEESGAFEIDYYKIIIPQEEPKQFTTEMLIDLKQGLDNTIQKSNPLFPNYNHVNKQETLTYTEAAKKEERIFNSTMMSKQETLEEVAEKYCLIHNIPTDQMIVKNNRSCEFETPTTMFIKGAKYQAKRMYSEEEVLNFGKLVLDTFHSEGRTHSDNPRLARIKYQEWFDEFKKK